jgi:class 3 adenylate cyclase
MRPQSSTRLFFTQTSTAQQTWWTRSLGRYPPKFTKHTCDVLHASLRRKAASYAYDGDRVMAIFVGDRMRSRAAIAGLKINWAVKNIVQPALNNQYGSSRYTVKHVVGIDTCVLHAAKIGVRGANDLVWVGPAANHAAKLTELSEAPTWITHEVFCRLSDDTKATNGNAMWEERTWSKLPGRRLYKSNWSWRID